MFMGEFALIQTVFAQRARALLEENPSAFVALGIGDDCALLNGLGSHEQLAISTDMFVEGTHFFAGTAPQDIGFKALAVNLSDLAAMGASPVGFTLALSLPTANQSFLTQFADGLFELAQQAQCPLIGGDTTRGPLNIAVTVFGRVDRTRVLRRDAAKAGQDLWVTGHLGGAALAVQQLYAGELPAAPSKQRLLRPQPRLAMGAALLSVANSALDLSDGLYGDLGHIARASQVDIEIDLALLPLDEILSSLPTDAANHLALCGGDDYELAFTADVQARDAIVSLGLQQGLRVTRIGHVRPAKIEPRVICLDSSGVPLSLEWHSTLSAYEHF
jgi:thiamine-monophosphate kinase